MSCGLELVGGVNLYLSLPQREELAEDVHPSHGCELRVHIIAQLLQHSVFCVYDSLDGRRALEYWDIVRLPSDKKRCEG